MAAANGRYGTLSTQTGVISQSTCEIKQIGGSVGPQGPHEFQEI